MCNRYEFERLGRLYDELGAPFIERPEFPSGRRQIAPSVSAPIIRAVDAGLEVASARWGLIPIWAREPKAGYATFNARAETVEKLPTFRSAFRSRRCLIPASAWFEYQDTPDRKPSEKKAMWRLSIDHGQDFALAGLWERWGRGEAMIDSFTMIMTEANEKISEVHDRMPILLEPKDYAFWLDRGINSELDVPALKAMLVPAADDRIVMERIR